MKKISLIFITLISVSILHVLHAQNSEIDSLENLLRKHLKKDTIRVNLLNETAYKLHTVDINKTLKYSEEARELSDKLNFVKGKAESLRVIGIYYSLKTNYPEALEYFQKSLVIVEETEDKRGISNCLINIGNIHRNHSNYLLALEYFQKSLVIAEEIEDKRGISNCLIHIGIIFYEMQDYDKALDYYQKSSKIYEELGEKIGITYTLNNIALIYEKQNKLDKALDYYDRCITIGKEINFTHILGWAYNGKGIVFMKQQKHEEALEFFLKGLKKRESIDENKEIAQSCNSIGKLYIETKQYHKAKEYLLRGYKIADKINNYLNLKDAAKGLAIVYEQSGNYKKSLEYHKIYKQYSDSLINQENIKKLAGFEIRTQYEKEKQAIVLEQQKKDALSAEKAKRQKILRNSFIAGFVLMLLLVVLVLRGFLQKRKANNLLTKQKNEIEEKNTELLNLNEEIQTQAEQLEDINQELEKLSIVASETDNAVIIADSTGKIEWINEGFTKMFGYNMQELIQNHGDNFINSSHNINITRDYNICIKEKKSVVYSSPNITKSGKEIWVQTTLTPVLDFNNNVIKILAVDSDITKIKEAENQLKELNATKDKLFSIIAHDLKSPFSALLGFSELLLENHATYDNDERETYIKFIHDGSIKTYKLLENLLTWAQSQTERIKFTPEKINIETLINEIILLLTENAENKEIKLILDTGNNLMVNADKNMIDTVIRNLVSNAIKFTPKGGNITIKSQTIKDENNQKLVEISVKDSGVGISPELQSKLFKITENITTKGTEKEKGTGLGLILCKEFVEKHGGKIWVESEIEKGSEFLFTIPYSN